MSFGGFISPLLHRLGGTYTASPDAVIGFGRVDMTITIGPYHLESMENLELHSCNLGRDIGIYTYIYKTYTDRKCG